MIVQVLAMLAAIIFSFLIVSFLKAILFSKRRRNDEDDDD